MKEFGLQAFTVRDHLDSKEDVRQAFKELKAMGYSHIQTALIHQHEPEFLKEIADEAGIYYCGTHYPWDKICDDVEDTVRAHRILGTTNLGIGSLPIPARTDINEFNAFVKKFNEMAEIYHKYGFKLTYHNHSFEFVKLDGEKTLFDRLVDELNPEATSFVLDTYWLQHAGVDVKATIERLAGRVDILHIKDMKYSKNTYNVVEVIDGKPVIKELTIQAPVITEIGEGNLNFKDIIETAEKCGVKYFVVEDDRAPDNADSYIAVKKSADYIIKNLLEK